VITDNVNTTGRSGACIMYGNDKIIWRLPELKCKAKYHLRDFDVFVKIISYWIIKRLWSVIV
jgi:hypothetical protein